MCLRPLFKQEEANPTPPPRPHPANLSDPSLWSCTTPLSTPAPADISSLGFVTSTPTATRGPVDFGSASAVGVELSHEVWLCRVAAALITHCRDPLLLMLHGIVRLKVGLRG
jgi:hypothetical protein